MPSACAGRQARVALLALTRACSGVGTFEAQHDAMAAALGLPASTGAISFDIVNETYAFALDDVVLGAVEQQGMDFWCASTRRACARGG
jgi:hypothetical protein